MVARVLALALNTYREAVRARVLYGLLAAALAAAGYSVVVASLSLNAQARTIADVGAASISLFAVVVAIVLGASALHRELELKTIFPILTRRLRREEYVVGKFVGLWATLAVFVALDGGTVLTLLALQTGGPAPRLLATLAAFAAALAVLLWRGGARRVFLLMPWAFAFFAATALVSGTAGAERQLVLTSCLLTLGEVAVVGAVALLFSAFSSPFLTAVFTFGVWLVGRSAETLAHLPERFFGRTLAEAAAVVAKVVPNLQLYVPPRAVLLGAVPAVPVWPFVARAGAVALAYATLLLALSVLVFRRRDFT
jgi:hypothetical protein